MDRLSGWVKNCFYRACLLNCSVSDTDTVRSLVLFFLNYFEWKLIFNDKKELKNNDIVLFYSHN